MIFVTSMRKSVLSVLIIRAIRSYNNPPFHRAFSPIHSKWTKWTRKWTRFFEHPIHLFFIFANRISDYPWWNHRFSPVVLSPLRYESAPVDRAEKITIDYDCRGCSNVAISGGPSASVFYIKDIGTRRTSLLQEKRLTSITRHAASLHCRTCV